MRFILTLLAIAALAGCAPRQDPGVPLPPPGSGEARLNQTDPPPTTP